MGVITSFLENVGILQRSSQAPVSLANPSEWMYSMFGPKTKSGVSVNSESILTHVAFYACAKVLGESLACLPLGLFRKDKNGNVEEMVNDQRHRLVNSEPSDLYTSFSFRVTAMLHLCVDGNFYAEIIRNGIGRPVELIICDNPAACTPFIDKNRQLWYKLCHKEQLVPAANVLHVKGLSSDGLKGKSPLQLFRENVGMGLATTYAQSSLWKNGTLSTGYLKHPLKLTADQVSDMRAMWADKYAGTDNAGKPMILENGMEYVPLTLKPADALFIETTKLSKEDMASIHRMPPHKIGLMERSTNNNIEHQGLEFVTDTMYPHAKNFEQEYNRKLLFPSEKGDMFYRHNMDALMRPDSKSRAEFMVKMFGIGAMSSDEVRAMNNMNPIPGGHGQKYMIPLNMQDISEPMPDPNDTNPQDNGTPTTDPQPDAAA